MKKFLSGIFLCIIFAFVFTNASSVVYAAPIPKCHDAKPSDTPRILRIDASSTDAKLYFTAVGLNNSYYFVAYGLSAGDQTYGAQFNYGNGIGHSVKYTVNSLTPGSTYYFMVRGGNGCKPGNWSSSVKAVLPLSGNTTYTY